MEVKGIKNVNRSRSKAKSKDPFSAPIDDYSKVIKNSSIFNDKHPLAPKWPFRLIICGPTGCGKTNLLLNLIFQYLYFNKLYVYAKMLDEDKYIYLQDVFEQMREKAEKIYGDQIDDLALFRSNLTDVDSVNDVDDRKQN